MSRAFVVAGRARTSESEHELKDNDVLSVDMRDVIKQKTIENLLHERAIQRVHGAMYAQPKVYLSYLKAILGFAFPEKIMLQFIEIKATRDLHR